MREKNRALLAARAETLVANGFSMDFLDVKYECKKCGDTGYIGEKRCPCFERALAETAVENFSAMKKYRDASLKSFRLDYYPKEEANGVSPREHMERVLAHVGKFIKNFGEGCENLLLYGKSGLGKTFCPPPRQEILKKGFAWNILRPGAFQHF